LRTTSFGRRGSRLRVAAKRDSQVVEEALRTYVGFDLLERVGARSPLSEAEALTLAEEERHR
jgi:hypothetical protein